VFGINEIMRMIEMSGRKVFDMKKKRKIIKKRHFYFC